MHIFLLSLFLGFISAYIWEFFCINIIEKTSFIVLGYRLHHSLYGLLFIAIGSINKKIFLVGFGVGIIAQHTLTDGFRFISLEQYN